MPPASVRPVLADAETAPLRGNRLLRHFRAFHRKPILPWMAPPRRGGLRTPAREGVRPARTLPPLDHRLIVNVPVRMQCLGLSPALPGGRTECVPPRKRPFASSRAFSQQGHLTLDSPPAEGRAPHAREGRLHAKHNITPLWPPAHPQATRGSEMPWHPHGYTSRTRRPRPSEKTASCIISWPFPLGVPRRAWSWHGGGRAPPAPKARHRPHGACLH